MSRIAVLALALLAAGQEPSKEPEALTLNRRLRARLAVETDAEVRGRLESELATLRESIRTRYLDSWAPRDAGAEAVLGFYRTRILTRLPKDEPAPELLKVGTGPDLGAECRDPAVGEEELVDLIKEWTGPRFWEGESTIEKTPTEDLLISAPPSLQRKVADVLKRLETDHLGVVRGKVALWSVEAPAEELQDPAGAPGARRLAALEWSFRVGQLSSAGSGTSRAVTLADGSLGRLPEGLSAELRVVPSAEGAWSVDARLLYRRIHEVARLATPKGELLLPRCSEVSAEEKRTLPAGRDVLLARLGPLPELPGVLFVTLRLDRAP